MLSAECIYYSTECGEEKKRRMLSNGTVLGGIWKIDSYLGEGACAKVYNVSSVRPGISPEYQVVAKVIPLSTGAAKSAKAKEQKRMCDTLFHEYQLYSGLLYGFPCAPRRPDRFYGEDQGYRYMVMEKLDTDLLAISKTQTLSVAAVGDIGLQILEGLKFLHKKRFLFIDIKPDNFMMKSSKLHFVDCKFPATFLRSRVSH